MKTSNKISKKSAARTDSTQGGVKSLARALTLLESLGSSETGVNLSDLAGNLGMPLSTAHRLLNSMLLAGFVEFDEDRGLWSVGLKTFSIGNAYLRKRDFVSQSRPFMKDLMAKSGETVNLAIRDHESIVFIAQVECKEVMRMVVQIGSRGPVHATAVGKALLSAHNEESALSILKDIAMPALTGRSITTPRNLAKELKLIRSQGYALDDEEQRIGLRCIAANIYDEFGDAIAAISISGPTVRMTRNRVAELGDLVVQTAAGITSAIGGNIRKENPP